MPPTPIPPPMQLPRSFTVKKSRILSQLAMPAEEYDDLSPKGSIDGSIRELIDGINAKEGWVTTSSCAGRVVAFVEGVKRKKTTDGGGQDVEGERRRRRRREGVRCEKEGDGDDGEVHGKAEGDEEDHEGMERTEEADEDENGNKLKLAAAGGKGGGGSWLFVSHEPVEIKGVQGSECLELLGMKRRMEPSESQRSFTEERLIHFKFEPMILHVLTASLSHAQAILNAALQAGFRESGALNLTSTTSEAPTPMVGVRSTGLALDSVIGRLDIDGEGICIVPDQFLEGLLAVANERFAENSKRIARFKVLLLGTAQSSPEIQAGKKSKGDNWEDASIRRERKRAEGLKRSQEERQRTNGETK